MTFRRPSLRVLVVDDDPTLTDLLATLLGVLGQTVYTANTGESALLQLAEAAPIDIVLIDLHMPGMNGESLADAIVARPHSPRLIGMSGATPSGDQVQHFHGFLHKPFSVDALEQVLTRAATLPAPLDEPPPEQPVLDTNVYQRLGAALSSQQRIDLYARTLANIRELAPSMDTADNHKRLELAHTLQGSCAMVGALELASLAAHIAAAPPGAFHESPPSYILLRAADRLERILSSLLLPE